MRSSYKAHKPTAVLHAIGAYVSRKIFTMSANFCPTLIFCELTVGGHEDRVPKSTSREDSSPERDITKKSALHVFRYLDFLHPKHMGVLDGKTDRMLSRRVHDAPCANQWSINKYGLQTALNDVRVSDPHGDRGRKLL